MVPVVAGTAGLSCSVLVPSSFGVRSSSIRSERKLLDDAGCWSCMCRIGVLSPDLVCAGRAGPSLMSSLPNVWLMADARRSGSLWKYLLF